MYQLRIARGFVSRVNLFRRRNFFNIFNFIVGYGDSTVFLHDTLYGIRGESIEIAWPISGRGKIH